MCPSIPTRRPSCYATLAEQNATIPVVVDYAAAHASESGGVYIDRDEHVGMVTSLWTGHLAEHAAALAELLDGRATMVRLVRYSEAELRVLQEQVFADIDWMEAIPATATGIGVGILENAVTLDVSSAEPTAVQQIVDHYGLGDKLVVTSDGTGEVFDPGRRRQGQGPSQERQGSISEDCAPDRFRLRPRDPGTCGGAT